MSCPAQLEALDREVPLLIRREPHDVSAAWYGVCLYVEADDSEIVKRMLFPRGTRRTKLSE